MIVPLPRSFESELHGCLNTICPPPGFPTKLEFIDVNAACKLFFDGRMAILVMPPILNEAGEIVTEGRAEILFYGNNFSNFSKTLFKILVGGRYIMYDCAEKLLHQLKALYFKDYEAAKKIIAADNPKEAKKFGRQVVGFDVKKWADVSEDIMLEIARLKLACNEMRTIFQLITKSICAKFRIPPKNFRFTEATADDAKFGAGISINDLAQKIMKSSVDTVRDEKLYDGENLLGISIQAAWMTYHRLVDADGMVSPVKNEEEAKTYVEKHESATMDTIRAKYQELYQKDFYVTTLFDFWEDMDEDVMVVEPEGNTSAVAAVDLKRSFTKAADDVPQEPLKRSLTEAPAVRSPSEAPPEGSARTVSEL
jgi:ribA/ribD-fused uncharacterized protein